MLHIEPWLKVNPSQSVLSRGTWAFAHPPFDITSDVEFCPDRKRLSNGYRIYDQRALTYLRLVRQSRTLGITLNDARNLIRLLEEDQRPCEQVHTLVGKRLREVEAAIRDLAALRRRLRMALRATSPGRCRPTELCPN